MEKRSVDEWNSGVEQVKQLPPASICLRSQFPDIVEIFGSVSGNKYVFNRGGSELMVDARDVPKMLEKRFGGNSCCGSGVKPLPYFIVI